MILLDKKDMVVDLIISGGKPLYGREYKLPLHLNVFTCMDLDHFYIHTDPFHLHGHVFSVLNPSGKSSLGLANPPQRDVIPVLGGGVIVRFVADNPGVWFLHCHMDWHLEAGLAVEFVERPADLRALPVRPPAEWAALC